MKIYVTKKVCTTFSRTSYKIVPLTHLGKYLHNDISETEVRIKTSVSNGSENL
jgi:hypothetical protein